MDGSNPQHYQPLSHAMRLPIGPGGTISPSYTYIQKPSRREEEEEDEDREENIVEQQLSSRDHDPVASSESSPSGQPSSKSAKEQPQEPIIHQYEPEQKRRPGRPRGSKNRQPQSQTPAKTATFAHQAANGAPHVPEVNPQNKAYYEFQWRVLHLCGEFYSAAEELVKSANPLVLAQCFHSGPENKVDPLVILNDAKRVCDALIANPSRLITAPPPPMYPIVPTFYQSSGAVSPPTVSSSSAPPANVINQPQSFVVSMGTVTAGQYPAYPTQTGPYPPPGFYPYPPGYPAPPPGTAYFGAQPLPSAHQGSQPPPSVAGPSSASLPSASSASSHSGAWSDEETDRLKRLAEEIKSPGGEIDWDTVVNRFGSERSRHQILIKATSLGLKETSTRPTQIRGVKRRRDGEDAASPPAPISVASPSGANSNVSPSESQTPASPSASPTTQKSPSHSSQLQSHQQQQPTKQASNLPWPMPTVAVNTGSPVMASSSQHDRDKGGSSHYRHRTSESSKPIMGPSHSQHQFMYHPSLNGK